MASNAWLGKKWHGIPIDPAIALACTVFGALSSSWVWIAGDIPVWAAGIISVSSSLAMYGVRRWPVHVTGFQAAVLLFANTYETYGTETPQFMLFISLGFLAMRSSARMLALAYLVCAAATAINVALPNPWILTWWRAVALMVALAMPVAIGRYVGE
ncbi:MAG: hypothetical protein ACRDXX_18095, partial [Stackebrandtia sp.]